MKAINSYRSSARVTEEIEDTRAFIKKRANELFNMLEAKI